MDQNQWLLEYWIKYRRYLVYDCKNCKLDFVIMCNNKIILWSSNYRLTMIPKYESSWMTHSDICSTFCVDSLHVFKEFWPMSIMILEDKAVKLIIYVSSKAACWPFTGLTVTLSLWYRFVVRIYDWEVL